jgi:hypothetical protein
MLERFSTKQWALIGAGAGLLVGLLLVGGEVDPAGRGEAYGTGQKAGFLTRYACLGAGVFALAAKLLAADEASSRAVAGYATGLLVLLSLAVLPPIVDRDEAAIESPQARDAAQFKAGFIQSCQQKTRQELPAGASVDVELYCECVHTGFTRGGQAKPAQMLALVRRMQSGSVPPRLRRVSDACASASVVG